MPEQELAELIRPAGYYQVKARRLRNLLKLIVERYDGSLDAMFRTDLATLREELLGVSGIGPETADAILLYAGGAADVCRRHLHPPRPRPPRLDRLRRRLPRDQGLLRGEFAADAALYNEYHALLVRVGKDYCRKTAPKCEACPLVDLLARERQSSSRFEVSSSRTCA